MAETLQRKNIKNIRDINSYRFYFQNASIKFLLVFPDFAGENFSCLKMERNNFCKNMNLIYRNHNLEKA